MFKKNVAVISVFVIWLSSFFGHLQFVRYSEETSYPILFAIILYLSMISMFMFVAFFYVIANSLIKNGYNLSNKVLYSLSDHIENYDENNDYSEYIPVELRYVYIHMLQYHIKYCIYILSILSSVIMWSTFIVYADYGLVFFSGLAIVLLVTISTRLADYITVGIFDTITNDYQYDK